jgi:hypothetical protein
MELNHLRDILPVGFRKELVLSGAGGKARKATLPV